MFLLIQSGSVDAESGAVYFTFQYVSINTGDLKRFVHVNGLYIAICFYQYGIYPKSAVCVYFFTFQYVSINTERSRWPSMEQLRLYIPICFY